jgi:subtilase family protein
MYETNVPQGRSYRIRFSAIGYVTIERVVSLNGALAVSRIYLVPDGWPYYLLAGVEIPFKPRTDLAAVALERPVDNAAIADYEVEARKLGLDRVTNDPVTHEKLDDVGRSVLYFVSIDSAPLFSFDPAADAEHGRVTAKPVRDLKALFSPYGGRVGSMAISGKGAIRIVDNQYLVRFPTAASAQEVERIARSVGASVLGPADPRSQFWLIEFADPQNLGRHLVAISRLYREGTISSGEPNLLFELKDEGGADVPDPATRVLPAQGVGLAVCGMGPKRDSYEGCQVYLARQQVPAAWCYLEQNVSGSGYGSPSVRVATIDKGITYNSSNGLSSHPDVRTARIGYCYDLVGEKSCGDGHWHGMGVYGIISGTPDNDFGITGIAPNATHIAIKSVSVIQATKRYTNGLLWVAGLAPYPGSAATPTQPPEPAIINCSHSLQGIPVPDYLNECLGRLTSEGRGGLGIVVVYAAGNEDRYIEDQNELATHPCTIGVANTEIRSGAEIRQSREIVSNDPDNEDAAPYGSNYGPYIDLCANGEGAPSLAVNNTETAPACNGDPQSGKGVQIFAGTSAATAMVSGAAALVLTMNPGLNWQQVRQVLCASARKIDCSNVEDDTGPDGFPRRGRWVACGSGNVASQTGIACPNAPKGLKWYSDFYGTGRLDVLEAVKMAKMPLQTPSPCEAVPYA